MLQRFPRSSCNVSLFSGIALGATLSLFVSISAHAASSHQHEAHVHGDGALNIAIDATDLQLELKVPGANVVGFEHAPKTAEQRERLSKAMTRLAAPANWLRIQPAGVCELEHMSIELLGERRTDEDKDAHSATHREDDGHGHAKHGGESKHEHAKHEEESEHAELHAEYHFHCSTSAQPAALEVQLDAVLINMRELKATVLSATAQKVQQIGMTKTVLPLR
jgi:hypothetical protein